MPALYALYIAAFLVTLLHTGSLWSMLILLLYPSCKCSGCGDENK